MIRPRREPPGGRARREPRATRWRFRGPWLGRGVPVELDRGGLALEGVRRARGERDDEVVAVLRAGGEAAEAGAAEAARLAVIHEVRASAVRRRAAGVQAAVLDLE